MEEKSAKEKKSVGKEIGEWVRSLLLAVVVALVLRTFAFTFIFVDGDSMVDTLHNGDILFVTMFDHYVGQGYDRGQVVICNYPGAKGYRVKRVIGLPGEVLELRQGVVYINGQEYPEDYLGSEKLQDLGPITLGDEEYYCMGDNRYWSRDSRSPDVGPIPEGEIRGVARARIFPFDRLTTHFD